MVELDCDWDGGGVWETAFVFLVIGVEDEDMVNEYKNATKKVETLSRAENTYIKTSDIEKQLCLFKI